MAKATGYFCDCCKTFTTTEDNLPPIGWLRLTVRTTQHDPNGGFDLCSNKCASQFARERAKAEKAESKPAKQPAQPPARKNAHVKAEEDGLTSVPGYIDRYLRSDAGALRQRWWGTYAGGYEQATGRGYSWIVDFDDSELSDFVSYVESIITVVKRTVVQEKRAQTPAEKNLISACNAFVSGLSEAA